MACSPDIAFVALVIGTVLVYVECLFPGRVIAGVAGLAVFCSGVVALAPRHLHLSGFLLILIAVATLLFTAQPLVSIAAGTVLALGAHRLVESPPVHFGIALAASIPFSLATAFLASAGRSARHNKQIDPWLDEILVASQALQPTGQIVARGVSRNAESTQPVAAGQQVRVLGIRGDMLFVEPWP